MIRKRSRSLGLWVAGISIVTLVASLGGETRARKTPRPDRTKSALAIRTSGMSKGQKVFLGIVTRGMQQKTLTVYFVRLEDGIEAYAIDDRIWLNYSREEQLHLLQSAKDVSPSNEGELILVGN